MSKLREILSHGTLQPDFEGQALGLICIRAGETESQGHCGRLQGLQAAHGHLLNFSLQAQSPPSNKRLHSRSWPCGL